jgi:hypothetical protein
MTSPREEETPVRQPLLDNENTCPPRRGRVRTAIAGHSTDQAADPQPSWSEGSAKQAIVDFVRATTEQGSPKFVPQEERIEHIYAVFRIL